MSFDGSRAELYRSRAAELRLKAKHTGPQRLKEQFEIMAHEYEKLAEMVEKGWFAQ